MKTIAMASPLICIGSRVTISGERLGTVTNIDETDTSFPYTVHFDDSDYEVKVFWSNLRLAKQKQGSGRGRK